MINTEGKTCFYVHLYVALYTMLKSVYCS